TVQAREAASQPTAVRSRSVAPLVLLARQPMLTRTRTIASIAAAGASVTSPVNGHASTRQATIPKRTGSETPDGPPPPVTNARGKAPVRALSFGFQMNVDSSTALVETAMRRAATTPATGPPIERASHQPTATARMPAMAISAVTASGSELDSHAAGARRK